MSKTTHYGPRVRSKVFQDPEYGSWQHWGYDTVGGNPTPTLMWDNPSRLYRYHGIVMNDVVVKDFKKRIAAGEIIINPMQYQETKIDGGGGSYIADGTTGTKKHVYSLSVSGGSGSLAGWLYKNTYDALPVTIPDRAKVDHAAKLNAIANIDKVPYPFMEDLLEIRETLGFIRHPLSTMADISKAAKEFRRKKWGSGAMSSADALADAWLKYRFALLPLARSVSQAWAAVESGRKTSPPRAIARGTNSVSSATANHAYSDGLNTFDVSRTYSYEGRAGIIYETTNPVDTWRENLGLRNKDLPRNLWNVVSLSFMIDRVVAVGQSISALTNLADPEVKILGGWYTTTERKFFSLRWIGQTQANYVITVNGDLYTDESLLKNRIPWTPSVVDALPTSLLPVWTGLVPGDITSIVDLVALIQARWR